jgi:hypothetical protein
MQNGHVDVELSHVSGMPRPALVELSHITFWLDFAIDASTMRFMLFLLLLVKSVSSARQELSDASTILQDLSKYSKLYVTYENCAWSSYENANNNNGGNACGVQEGGDSTSWYMGLTECFRANVAYSLYGVLKGQEDKGCRKGTFINSFFTTQGIDSFVDYLTYAGATFTEADDGGNAISSACQVAQNDNGNNGGNNQNNDYNANNVKTNADTTSYGVGCSDTDKTFVVKNYAGAYCDERSAKEVTDTLTTFNSEIGQVKCIKIYDDGSSAAAAQNNANGDAAAEDGQDEAEDGAAEQEEEANGDAALGLLQYSQACDVNLFPKKCPDPYGVIRSHSRYSAHALTARQYRARTVTKSVFSWFFLSIGALLIAGSGVAYARKMQAKNTPKSPKKSKRNLNLFTRSKSQDGAEAAKSNGESRPGFFTRVKSMLSRTTSK